MQYIIVQAPTGQELVQYVNGLMGRGMEPVGGHNVTVLATKITQDAATGTRSEVTTITYTQAMTGDLLPLPEDTTPKVGESIYEPGHDPQHEEEVERGPQGTPADLATKQQERKAKERVLEDLVAKGCKGSKCYVNGRKARIYRNKKESIDDAWDGKYMVNHYNEKGIDYDFDVVHVTEAILKAGKYHFAIVCEDEKKHPYPGGLKDN